MKTLSVILLLFTLCSYGQEPIYNTNRYNIHLLNFASPKEQDFGVFIDNSFEYYNNNKQMNSTNLFFFHKIRSSFNVGINAEYNYLNNSNNFSNLDFIADYKLVLKKDLFLKMAVNLGARNSNIDYSNLQSRYTYSEPLSTQISFKKTNFNLGLSSVISYKEQELGFFANHLNQAKLPMDGDKIPIKYTAYLRNRYRGFSSTLSYVYQDNFFLNPTDMSYYYDMLNYFGINLDYNWYRLDFGAGYKYISNNSNVFSLNLGYSFIIGRTDMIMTYSPSLMQSANTNSIAQFHQLSIYFAKSVRRHQGSVRFL